MDPFSCHEIGPLLFPHLLCHLLKLGPLLVAYFKFSPLLSLLLPLLLTYFEFNLLLLLCFFATCLLWVYSFVDVPSPSLSIYFKFVCLALSFVKFFFIILAFSLPTYFKPHLLLVLPLLPFVQVWELGALFTIQSSWPYYYRCYLSFSYVFVCSCCLYAWSICMHVCLVS
jgi:hypothetical protein